MTSNFRHVALIGKYQASSAGAIGESSRQALDGIARFLQHQGCSVAIEAETASNTGLLHYPSLTVEDIGARCDLGLVVGGDGTMLGIGRRLARFGTPLVGINQGRLGFITDIPFDTYQATLPPMLEGDYEEDSRPLIQACVMRAGQVVFEALAMNDVVVNRGATAGMVELRVEVGGRFVANQRADGLIIASPTGSTAYSLSAGGPMLHPSIPGWVLVPIAPHTLSNRPIVLSDATEVVVEVVSGRDVSASFDMQSLASLLHGDRILLSRSAHCVRFLHPQGWNYFATLRKKLRWNDGDP
ncbi:NAD kinase [Verminephrobacter eiseniae]|uniref:NAD kinase n=1 Tax=Verminephrobacter eiseniae TaxID=364317 RepID=UPI002237317C|nr:NAD kinase [Verminephrobacter eiseniae]MCW5233900.1 NAD kinase [Verminephrobacter eiseniae]MCW5294545.1 NAD kinase [Verminephrobacter eiseniae]MCW8187517.1 NAD kinase [Verminephrobacter eiseniae]MCW8225605.1 NAD kinase [Verminephrobacter eiseniae]MCW8236497.1 NAD kinase [Verminephrobacter eiseniae]